MPYNYPALQIDDIADLGKVHGDKLDEIAEANDGAGMLLGWIPDRINLMIELVFEHALIQINYQFQVTRNRMIYRVDEQDDKPFYKTVKQCIANGDHLRQCDDDGFCNYCGHQE